MRTTKQGVSLWVSVGALILLLIGALLPAHTNAVAVAAACTDGYALWANDQAADETLVLAGSQLAISGTTHTNADLRISGSNNRLAGTVEYVTLFQNSGDSNEYLPPTQLAASLPPLSYTLTPYQPGGAAALVAQAADRYTFVEGDLDVAEPTILDGLYYVTGKAKLSASDISGSFTIVAAESIEVSGSNLQADPYADGLLFLAAQQVPGTAVIRLAGSNSTIRGVISGLGGTVELAGSSNSFIGSILGGALKLSGSNLRFNFASEYCPGQPGSGAPQEEAYAPNEIVVKLFNAGDLAAVAAANGLNPAPLSQFGARPIYRLLIIDGTDPLIKAAQLQPSAGAGGDSRVEYAEPNYATQSPEARRGRSSWVIGGADSDYTGQWAPGKIRLSEAHQVSKGRGVTVAVLDTGIDPTHPAFSNRLVPGFDFVDFDDDPREEGTYLTNPGFGHGTHVAGLVALAAPEAKIMPVRVLDIEGMGNIWVLSEGLIFAAERGPDGLPLSGDEAQVINLSLGTLRQTNLLDDLMTELTCADDDDDDNDDKLRCSITGGVAIIAAAGNGGDSTPQYPAAENVAGSLAVGASDRNDRRASFSTYGSWVLLAAPGEAIFSSVPGGGYGTWSGTSMAAPLTAGTAALVRSAMPELSGTAVIARLVDSASPICGPIIARLDAAAAVGVVLDRTMSCSATSSTYRLFLPSLLRLQ